MGKGELIALLSLSSWCLVVVGRLFLTVPLGCLQFVIVVFPDHTHLLFLMLLHPTVKEKRHLQENTLLGQGHRRCCAVPSTSSKRLEGDAHTRKYII